MTRNQYDEFVYPTIGKIGSAKHLQEKILETVNRVYNIGDNEEMIKIPDFYCYVSQYVYEDWRLNNIRMKEYEVIFQCVTGGIYIVRIKNH